MKKLHAMILLLTLTACLMIQPALAQNTIPSGCITAPLPTTPTGPTWRGEYNTWTASTPKIAKFTVWRKPCTNTTAVTLVTFETVSGSVPFICSSGSAAIQNSNQFSRLDFLINPTQFTNLCSDLLVTSTVILKDSSSASTFNPSNAFTFIPDTSPSTSVPTVRIEVGSYNASDYGNTAPLPITGKQSGNWYSPSRSGEGFVLEVGASGTDRTMIATWFTYKDGQQLWMIGSASLPVGTTSIQVPMFITRGGQFGAAFNPATVVAEAWGTLTFTFPGCNAATVNYAPLVGAGGTIQMVRLKTQIDGLGCP